MSLTTMCNINLVYFVAAVLMGIFVADDFRSGYCKNLFAVRPQKGGYIFSKTIVGFFGGALMLIAFFIGAMVGGAVSGLPFALGSLTAGNIVLCMLSKILLMAVFAGIYVLMGVIGKQKLWLTILLSLGVGMFLFNIIPMVTPAECHDAECAALSGRRCPAARLITSLTECPVWKERPC